MVNLKLKSDKHALDNEKRRKSLKEREKAKLNQSQIIKEALSTSALSSGSSKRKIVFDEDGIGDEETTISDAVEKSNGNDKTILFDDSGSEEDFELKEKVHFGGKKGFELLNLQSTYGNDERFKIDERFLDEEKQEAEEKNHETPENSTEGEKIKQLKILESVLGEPVVEVPEGDKKAKKRTFEMIRYDASNKEHEKYEIKTQPTSKSPSKKRKERKKMEKILEKEPPKTEVSKEKFYEVSSEIKDSFKENAQFSLLQTYGGNYAEDDDDHDADNYDDKNDVIEQEEEEEVNGYEMEEEKSEDEDCLEVTNSVNENKKLEKDKVIIEEKPKSQAKGAVAKGIWKESFFFQIDDPRLKEGLEFINKKDSEEASEAAEVYDKTRKTLREILRLHTKKQLHKKDPFKNKVGGMSKKQLANLKYRNSKNNFNKRKPKPNPIGSS